MKKTNVSAENRLLTSEDIAAILKVSLNTVQNKAWQKRAGCPLIKIGKRIYALESAFWKWVNERGMSHAHAMARLSD